MYLLCSPLLSGRAYQLRRNCPGYKACARYQKVLEKFSIKNATPQTKHANYRQRGEVGSVSVGVGVACALLYYCVYKGNGRAGKEGGRRQRQSLKVNFILIFIYVCA